MGSGFVPGQPRAPTQPDVRTQRALRRLAGIDSGVLYGEEFTRNSAGQLKILIASGNTTILQTVGGLGFVTQTANKIFAGPGSGGAALPTFRTVVAADLGTGTANATKVLRGDLVWGAVTEGMITLSDVATLDVTSTMHGLAPKSPGDATKFLNGAATPAYALVKDSDLSTSDITTNNATAAKHGFLPKLSGDASTYLDGSGAFSTPTGSASSSHVHGLTRWIADGTATVFNLPDVAEYLDMVFNGGSGVDPATVTLAADGTTITFDAAPAAGNIIAASYVIAVV